MFAFLLFESQTLSMFTWYCLGKKEKKKEETVDFVCAIVYSVELSTMELDI